MRPVFLCVLFAWFCLLPQQTDIWHSVPLQPDASGLRDVTLGPRQLTAIKKSLAERVKVDNWPCAEGDEPDWAYWGIPVSPEDKTLLAEAGPGCARGGQGANGAMWLLQLRNDKVTFLVTPEDHFNGWLYSIQSDTRHGFHAIVLGWHLSAGEAILVYFRFDGKLYRAIGSAKILFDDNDIGKIVPDTAS